MRSRVPLFALLLLVSAFILPVAAHAGGIPFFGPIIPGSDIPGDIRAVCPASWGMLIEVINNIISFLLTIAIVFVAPLTIAYAGFLFVVNPVNANGISEAKGILLNTVIGLVIAFAGWLIVAAVMAVLYHPSTGTTPGTTWGAWTGLIYGNASDVCLKQEGALPDGKLNQVTPGTGVVTTTSAPRSTVLSTAPGNACNPATILAVASRPANATQKQANLLACIAQGESTCGTTNPPFNLNFSWNILNNNGKASTAAGAYQVLLSTNHECYEQSACYSAAGVAGPLNCQNAFQSNGMVKVPETPLLLQCKKAAGNLQCSAAAAVCLLNKQSFQSAYATNPYTPSCMAAYGS